MLAHRKKSRCVFANPTALTAYPQLWVVFYTDSWTRYIQNLLFCNRVEPAVIDHVLQKKCGKVVSIGSSFYI